MRTNKFNAKKCVIDGILFDSKSEGRYYVRLKSYKDLGIVKELILQPSYTLQEKFKHGNTTIREIVYVADFYIVNSQGEQVVIDIKGHVTQSAFIKRKLFLKKYPELRLDWFINKNGSYVNYFEAKKKG